MNRAGIFYFSQLELAICAGGSRRRNPSQETGKSQVLLKQNVTFRGKVKFYLSKTVLFGEKSCFTKVKRYFDFCTEGFGEV